MSVADANTKQAATDTPAVKPSSGLFWLGLGLAIGSLAAFFIQVFAVNALVTPWYLPIGGTVAAVLVMLATARRRRWWSLSVAALCVALAGFEWFFLLSLTVLPSYTGPVIEGGDVPAFHAALADGTEIDESYFASRPMTAVIFFQGRWCPFCMTQLKELEAHQADFERAGAEVMVVSIEGLDDAAKTQRDFPHLKVVSDQKRELSEAIDLVNKHSAPDGGDSAAPTMLLVDGQGKVRWFHRPVRFIARPSALDIVAMIERQKAGK
jgi:peroxiredoxin